MPDVIDSIEDALGQEVPQQSKLKWARAFYDALVAHKNVHYSWVGALA